MFNVLGGLLNVFTIERFGRKKLLSCGLFMIVISYIINMMGDVFQINILIPIGVCIFMFSFACSLGGILYVYQVEILPAELVAPASIIQWIFTLLISYYTLPLVNTFGIFSLYVAFFAISFIGWFLFEGYAVESKGLKMSKIISAYIKKQFWE